MGFKNMRKTRKVFIGLIALVIVVGVIAVSYKMIRAATQSVSDTFADETKLGTGTTKVNLGSGQITLATCYSPNPSWSKIADTTVRDISNSSASVTIAKDIYCDNDNCLLWTDGGAAPTTVCVATDSNVYGNILWSKADSGTSVTWSDSNFSIIMGDIGGTHTTPLTVGNGSTSVASKNWLERFYTNTAGMFNSMDLCKAKGLGWRLPNILELDSIRDQAKGSSPYTRVPNITANSYWSSSEFGSTNAYFLYFADGSVVNITKSFGGYVRCVRAY